MARRLSEKEKNLIISSFVAGMTIDELSIKFDCTRLTITRNLKKNFSEEKYRELLYKSKASTKLIDYGLQDNSLESIKKLDSKNQDKEDSHEEFMPSTQFTEIIPLNYEIEESVQKDLSSVPISEIEFPKIVYMIVDKKIELETKYLKDYPEWQFLSKEELNRKTIEIFIDLKIAKRFCNKEQKVIKVPNPNVFKIVAPILLNKGISRIVIPDKLIAL